MTTEEIVQNYQVKLLKIIFKEIDRLFHWSSRLHQEQLQFVSKYPKVMENTDNQTKENKMKDTVKTLMIVAGVGFTLIAITWIGIIATLLITWIGGII